jgi:hypothetical protein
MAKTGIVTRAFKLWRVESWKQVGSASFFSSFLEFGHHTYWSRKLTRGLACGDRIDRQGHAFTTSARVLRQFSNTCGVMKAKEKVYTADMSDVYHLYDDI